jgi:hypothetical protein
MTKMVETPKEPVITMKETEQLQNNLKNFLAGLKTC